MPFKAAGYISGGMRAIARAIVARIDLRVEGVEHLPVRGPAILVCRHHHHLYDGAVLLAAITRPVRIVVGLDWAKDARERKLMEMLCRIADWPIVLRDCESGNPWGTGYERPERRHYARKALVQSVDILRRGELLAMFPEGYPTVDPIRSRPSSAAPHFAGGHVSIAERARRFGITVPLVPVGFAYAGPLAKPTAIALRFGAPESIESARVRRAVGCRLEVKVRALST